MSTFQLNDKTENAQTVQFKYVSLLFLRGRLVGLTTLVHGYRLSGEDYGPHADTLSADHVKEVSGEAALTREAAAALREATQYYAED